ncbi:MAG TPA: hypothetical protein PK252_06250 [Bacteroidales bacterium]|nr:hypothetical protein [Bacteroidales bacterium]
MNIKTYINIVSIGIIASLVSSCGNDDYDWNNVIPGSQRITTLDNDTVKVKIDTIEGNNTDVVTLKAIAHGGSTFDWIASSNVLIPQNDAEKNYIVHVKANSTQDTYAWLKVQETTYGGIKGKPDSMQFFIIGYCEFNKQQLLGNGSFVSKMSYYAPFDVNLSEGKGDTILYNNFNNMRWQLKLVISKDVYQKITIPANQYFVYNDEIVTVKGNGKYNTCKSLFVINYAICRLSGDTLAYSSGVDSLRIK